VELTHAGHAPTYIAALGVTEKVKSAAIVLNTRSQDASVMRLGDAGVSVQTVPTHRDANAWAVSPSRRFAIAWSDATLAKNPDAVESFQDVTVIDTGSEPPIATRLSVGYRPSRIFYAADEGRAFVVSQASVSVIELEPDAAFVSRDVELARTASEKPVDVSVVPAENLALFRVEGSPNVSFVELRSGVRVDVTLSGPVTDLDLVAGGTSALAVVRARTVAPPDAGAGGAGSAGEPGAAAAGGDSAAGGMSEAGGAAAGGTFGASGADSGSGAEGEIIGTASGGVVGNASGGSQGAGSVPPPPAPSEVALLRIAEILRDPTRFDRLALEDVVGSVTVSQTGARAVLYTNAVALDRVTVLATNPADADYLSVRRVKVRAPVEAVFIAPDAAHAVVALRPLPGGTSSGFGLVPLLDELPAIIKTAEAPITGVAFAPAPSTSAILTSKSARTAYIVRLPERHVQAFALPNLPLAAGIIAEEGLGYVAQKHPEGQLTLLELATGDQRTLTGFELAGRVIDGN
jgi:hypothetical protein